MNYKKKYKKYKLKYLTTKKLYGGMEDYSVGMEDYSVGIEDFSVEISINISDTDNGKFEVVNNIDIESNFILTLMKHYGIIFPSQILGLSLNDEPIVLESYGVTFKYLGVKNEDRIIINYTKESIHENPNEAIQEAMRVLRNEVRDKHEAELIRARKGEKEEKVENKNVEAILYWNISNINKDLREEFMKFRTRYINFYEKYKK